MTLTLEPNSQTVTIDLENDCTSISIDDSLCEVCLMIKPSDHFVYFSNCGHEFCMECVKKVFECNISESRVDLQCLRCDESIPQNEIKNILDAQSFEKYLDFTVRKFLATQQPYVCYCLTPNCPYACINSCSSSTSQQEERDHFVCRMEGCHSEYCNSCKRPWHSGKTCEDYASEHPEEVSDQISDELKKLMGTKNCPVCGIVIEKLSDGSCNQVICSVCQTSFCWLCGRPVSEMHYLR